MTAQLWLVTVLASANWRSEAVVTCREAGVYSAASQARCPTRSALLIAPWQHGDGLFAT